MEIFSGAHLIRVGLDILSSVALSVQSDSTKVEHRTALLQASNQVRVRWDTGAVSPGASESHNLLRLNNTISVCKYSHALVFSLVAMFYGVLLF